jgi:hypothetical protein
MKTKLIIALLTVSAMFLLSFSVIRNNQTNSNIKSTTHIISNTQEPIGGLEIVDKN